MQEGAKGLEQAKGKEKGKKVVGNVSIVEAPGVAEVRIIATDRGLGDVTKFYTKGIVRTLAGSYRISRVLVEAGCVFNLMRIHILYLIGAKVQNAGGMMIATVTSALAKSAFFSDGGIAIAEVACDQWVYTLLEFLFKSCIRLFKGTKNSHAAVSYGVNKTYNKTTNKRKSYPPSSPKRS